MSKQFFLPECMCDVDLTMTYEKLKNLYESNSFVVGKVLRLNSKDNIFEVSLGKDLIGIMPIEESNIYPLYKNERKLSYSTITLVGKTIQAKIISLDNQIILSRKANMLEALEIIKHQTEVNFAAITSFSQLSAFIDVGAGIIGKCSTYNLSTSIFRNAEDIGFSKGDILPVKIIGFQNDINSFDLSIVDTFESVQCSLNETDIVTCKVFGSLNDGIGYYVLINGKYSGIVDSPLYYLHYGDEISASIHKITDRGVRLKIVEKL